MTLFIYTLNVKESIFGFQKCSIVKNAYRSDLPRFKRRPAEISANLIQQLNSCYDINFFNQL